MNVRTKTYDRLVVTQKELNSLPKNLYIELKCPKCHTIIQSDIKYTPQTFMDFNKSPQKCPLCSFVYVEASVFKYRTLPFSLTQNDLEDIEFNREYKERYALSLRERANWSRSHPSFRPKIYKKDIPPSQSSIDDFLQKRQRR